jgi:hypothetical protein
MLFHYYRHLEHSWEKVKKKERKIICDLVFYN